MPKEKKVKFKKAIRMVSALAQDTRMSVFQLLMQRASMERGGLPAGVIAETLEVPSATMSFHLNQLTNAGVLKSDKQGRQVIYAVKKKSVKALVRFLSDGESTGDDLEIEDDDTDMHVEPTPSAALAERIAPATTTAPATAETEDNATDRREPEHAL